ncbi:MAG: DUF4118 domain-containing protein [Chloroflexi bacterium]|nr:DUF4118 domain-containing protein [Chloroflexota bacterium]MCL5274872.1 DUF4118 domain-containing protein [Chloroflexota bacterium]
MNFRNRYLQFYWRGIAILIARSLTSLLAVAAMTAVLYALHENLRDSTLALLYLLPVGFVATLWGLGPGIVAALSAFLALNFFFTNPRFTFSVAHTQDLLALAVFLVVAVAISQLVGRSTASLQEARLRERDVIHLYELMSTLAGLRNQDTIARTSVATLLEVFQARAVEVVIQRESSAIPRSFLAPAQAQPPTASPDQVVALITPRGLLGEIHLWHTRLLSPAEERLLNTFASQVALALERVILAQAETRSRVLEESDRLKTALLSSVSHELRTPLATIKAAATSLRSGNVSWDSAARNDLIAAIDEESDHLNRLVENLLDMSRIEAGALKPQRQWNILADILAATVQRLRRATEKHHLEIDVSDELPLAPVDHKQIDQVFTNLISNALKYAPEGTTIRISARVRDQQFVEVEVYNEGPQIREEDMARIFDKFYRVTAADRVTGTGLGLSICKGIIEAHGGRIWASNLAHGLAFYFTLPLTLDGQRMPRLPAENESAE